MPYKTILISLEGKEEENSVIHEAVRVASNLDAELMVIHVNDPGAGKVHMVMGLLQLKTEDDLRNQFRTLGYETIADKIKIMIVEGTNYPKEIAKASENADLLVTGHHHKNRLFAALIDSIDERVSDLVSCPMLIVPCGK